MVTVLNKENRNKHLLSASLKKRGKSSVHGMGGLEGC